MGFWSVTKKDKTPADVQLDKIRDLLFPKLDLRESVQEGQVVKYHVDHSVDMNLDAALTDLQDGHNDEVTQKTISRVVDRLNEVRRLLEATYELDKDAQYILVEDYSEEKTYQEK